MSGTSSESAALKIEAAKLICTNTPPSLSVLQALAKSWNPKISELYLPKVAPQASQDLNEKS